jgi:outer membrane biosynthesis protein TonB
MLVTVERTQTATYSIIAGLLLVSAGSLGAGAGHAASGASLMSATSACAHRPATTTSASTVKKAQAATDAKDAAVITNKVQSAAPPTPTPAAATASATPTPTATDPATPSATTTPTPSTSPSPDPSSPTPTPTKTPTPTPTATPSPSPKPGTAQLCVLVQPFSSSKVHPGGNATYAIWVWSTGAASNAATVTVTIGQVSDVESPTFTVCAQAKGDACSVGDLLTSQSDELVAAAHVRDTAAAGEKVTLTATAKATKADSFDADATIDVVAASTSTGSGTTTSSGVGDSLPGTSLPTLPDGSFTSTGGSDPSGLFPTVSPNGSATASSSPGRNGSRHVDATTVSSTLPLDSRLIGGQLAGLVVLASAIAIAIARLSLRSRPHDDTGPK